MSGVAAMKGYVVMGFSILALQLASSAAFAAEGPTSTIGSVSLDEARVSRYAEGTARDLAKDPVNKQKASMPGLKHSAKSEQKQLRPAHVAKSIRADDFYFHDASSLLLTDRDADGYFSEFRVRFDAGSDLGDVLDALGLRPAESVV